MIFRFESDDDEKASLGMSPNCAVSRDAPAWRRADDVRAFAIEAMRKAADECATATVYEHIKSLCLRPSQINSLHHHASRRAYSLNPKPDDAQLAGRDCTYGEWNRAGLIVASAAKALMLLVPLREPQDGFDLLDIMMTPGSLPLPNRRAAIKRLQRFVADAIEVAPFRPSQSFRQGASTLAVEKHRGRVEAGEEYVFRFTPSKSKTGGWHTGRVLRVTAKTAIVKFPWGDERVSHQGDIYRAKWHVVARFARDPDPLHVALDVELVSNPQPEGTVLTVIPTDRICSRDWHIFADGKQFRMECPVAVDDTHWHYVDNDGRKRRLLRSKWRPHRIVDWLTPNDVTPEVRAAAVSLAASVAKRRRKPTEKSVAPMSLVAAKAATHSASMTTH